DEMLDITLGTGFTGITEIETGPDGNLYILTYDRESEGQGSLLKIIPSSMSEGSASSQDETNEEEN
ncbi:MAG: hypothetical protein ACRD8Z_28455, partial [Nitrososphaeraceae archaeon]